MIVLIRKKSMSKDIFILAKETQGKSNPIVAALLYTYCSAAAHWYVRNRPVEDVFDLMWLALEDYNTGKTLVECLTGYGLSTVIPVVKEYVDKVKAFRRHHTNSMPAPETTLLFKSGKRADSTFGIQNELENLGGSWNNLLEYARIWAYMMRDWKTGMKLPMGENTSREFKKFIVSFSAPGVYAKLRVHFPVWGWEVTVGRVKSVYLGLLVSNLRQDALRFALVSNSDLVGDKPWPDGRRPYLFALDQVTGEVEYMSPIVEHEDVLRTVMPMYRAARIGPNLPLPAMQGNDKCLSCGYRRMCFGDKGNTIHPASLNQLLHENKRERLYLTGTVETDQDEFEGTVNVETD